MKLQNHLVCVSFGDMDFFALGFHRRRHLCSFNANCPMRNRYARKGHKFPATPGHSHRTSEMFTSLVSTYLPLVCLASCKLGEHKTREQIEADINQSHQLKLHHQNYSMILGKGSNFSILTAQQGTF